MKDIYADDITLDLAPATKLIDFFAAKLATALADRQPEDDRPDWHRETPGSDPDITAVNAAFALGLVERHNLVEPTHRLYALADAAAADAPSVDFSAFKERFKSLGSDPSESEYRKALVDVTRAYAVAE